MAARPDAEVTAYRKKRMIVPKTPRCPRPVQSFAEAGFTPEIIAQIDKAGFGALLSLIAGAITRPLAGKLGNSAAEARHARR